MAQTGVSRSQRASNGSEQIDGPHGKWLQLKPYSFTLLGFMTRFGSPAFSEVKDLSFLLAMTHGLQGRPSKNH